jgi:hypothetical protein
MREWVATIEIEVMIVADDDDDAFDAVDELGDEIERTLSGHLGQQVFVVGRTAQKGGR